MRKISIILSIVSVVLLLAGNWFIWNEAASAILLIFIGMNSALVDVAMCYVLPITDLTFTLFYCSGLGFAGALAISFDFLFLARWCFLCSVFFWMEYLHQAQSIKSTCQIKEPFIYT